MAYKKSSFSKVSKYSKSGVKKSKQPMTPRTATKTIKQYVRNEIAKNIENKYTTTKTLVGPVGNVQFISTNVYGYTHFVWSPGAQTSALTDQLFNIPQGTGQNQRIGNSIKLKRWIIKGMISPNIFGNQAPYTALGYVDVYFGRLKLNTKEITNQVSDLYQNGNGSITPSMRSLDTLFPINNDIYKIYWHKRFKTGTSGVNAVSTQLPLASEPVNNDYKLTHTFGFDVCKYILKDRKITFSDSTNTPLDVDINTLTLFTIFTPFTGQAFNTNPTILPTYMQASCISYAEFEDA